MTQVGEEERTRLGRNAVIVWHNLSSRSFRILGLQFLPPDTEGIYALYQFVIGKLDKNVLYAQKVCILE